MTTVQELLVAGHRLRESIDDATRRSSQAADGMKATRTALAPMIRGSRSGEEAVRHVDDAERKVRECAAKLLALQRSVDAMLNDISR